AETLLKLANNFRSNQCLPETPPDDREIKSETRKQIAKLARDVVKNLRKSVEEEMKVRREWRGGMVKELGVTTTRGEIVASANSVAQIAVRFGISGTHEFNLARLAFEAVPYDEMFSAVGRLPKPGQESLSDVPADISNTIRDSKSLVASFRTVLKRVED